MTPEDFLRQLRKVKTWRRGNKRAPHKPLLLLLMLGRIAHQRERLIPFRDVEGAFHELWSRFGPPSRGLVQYPFNHLETDGIWEIPRRPELPYMRKGQLRVTELRKHNVEGGFPREVAELLISSPELTLRAAQLLLDEHFPNSLHDEILEAAGLTFESTISSFPIVGREPKERKRMVIFRRPRRLRFRREVLQAYEERCAICEFDLRINNELLGLEAAHIQWHSHRGPDDVSNGLALCLLHHRALDRGAVGLEASGDGFRVVVSSQVRWKSPAASQLVDFSGSLIRSPRSRHHAPDRVRVRWHRTQVFRN